MTFDVIHDITECYMLQVYGISMLCNIIIKQGMPNVALIMTDIALFLTTNNLSTKRPCHHIYPLLEHIPASINSWLSTSGS